MKISSSSNIYANNSSSQNKIKDNNNSFDSLLNNQTTNTPTTPNAPIIKKEISTEDLIKDILSLLKTGFTVGELEAFEERLKEILKMKKDGKSDKEIESALRKLALEIQEAKKKATGQILKKADDSTITTSTNNNIKEEAFDFNTMFLDIKNMLQEIEKSSKNTTTNDKNEEEQEAYDKLRMLLKMSW